MKRRVEFTPIDLRGVADIYSIKIEGEQASEFLKFLVLFRTETDKYLLDDFNRIAEALKKISEQGALERFFRPEGRMGDRIFAVPLEIRPRDKTKHGTLRAILHPDIRQTAHNRQWREEDHQLLRRGCRFVRSCRDSSIDRQTTFD